MSQCTGLASYPFLVHGTPRLIGLARLQFKSYAQDMRVAISLPESLLHAADAFAQRAGMSRSELFRAAVTDYIEAHKHDHVREALDEVYADQPSQLNAELMQMQLMSLPKENWW